MLIHVFLSLLVKYVFSTSPSTTGRFGHIVIVLHKYAQTDESAVAMTNLKDKVFNEFTGDVRNAHVRISLYLVGYSTIVRQFHRKKYNANHAIPDVPKNATESGKFLRDLYWEKLKDYMDKSELKWVLNPGEFDMHSFHLGEPKTVILVIMDDQKSLGLTISQKNIMRLINKETELIIFAHGAVEDPVARFNEAPPNEFVNHIFTSANVDQVPQLIARLIKVTQKNCESRIKEYCGEKVLSTTTKCLIMRDYDVHEKGVAPVGIPCNQNKQEELTKCDNSCNATTCPNTYCVHEGPFGACNALSHQQNVSYYGGNCSSRAPSIIETECTRKSY